jgi:hypothetical protein
MTIKSIAYLHAYCGLDVESIVSRYPKVVTRADVHIALGLYFRDPDPIDAEVKRELAFNGRDALASSSMALPRVAGLHGES